MIRYKIDVLEELKKNGYTTYSISKEGYFSGSIVHKFRKGEIVTTQSLDTLCKLLKMQVGDIIEYVPDEE